MLCWNGYKTICKVDDKGEQKEEAVESTTTAKQSNHRQSVNALSYPFIYNTKVILSLSLVSKVVQEG